VFDFLLEREFGFICTAEECELFPQLDLEYESFYDYDSMIIDLDLGYSTVINTFSNKNKNLLINALQLRLFFNPTISQLTDILETFSALNICSIEMIMPHSSQVNQGDLENIVEGFEKVTSISIFSSPIKELLSYKQSSINYMQETIVGESDCGKIDESFFCCNLLTFCESQKFNTCLNKKISIDVKGNIKNCPSCKQTFGVIGQKPLVELKDHLNFKRVWGVSKNQIDVCKDCEFRHMCTDCRAYIKDQSNTFSQPSKCNYNPYIAKWKGQEGYVSVEEWKSKNK